VALVLRLLLQALRLLVPLVVAVTALLVLTLHLPQKEQTLAMVVMVGGALVVALVALAWSSFVSPTMFTLCFLPA
jgi:hypothetical protein